MTSHEEKAKHVLGAWDVLKKDPGLHRRLRRIEEPADALFLPGTHWALHHLRNGGYRGDRALEALLVASHAKDHVDGQLGRQFWRADVKDARFRRLATSDRRAAHEHLRHMVAQCGGAVNIHDLVDAAYWWNEISKKRLANDYYNTREAKEE